MIKINFAINLKQARENKGLSQAEFARMLNISYQTYNGYETKGREPKLELLVNMAKFLDISIDKLLELETKTPPIDTYISILRHTNINAYLVDPQDVVIDEDTTVFCDAGNPTEEYVILEFAEFSIGMSKESFVQIMNKITNDARSKMYQSIEKILTNKIIDDIVLKEWKLEKQLKSAQKIKK